MGRGPDRPVKTRRQPHGLGRAARMKPTSHGPRPGDLMGSGPARPFKFVKTHGPTQSDPSNFDTLDPAPPRPSHVRFCRPGPVRPTSSFLNARPSPAPPITCSFFSARISPAHIKYFKLSARPDPSHVQFFRPGPAHCTLKTLDPTRPGPARPITISRTARPAPSALGDPWKTSAFHDIAVYWLLVGFTL